MQLASPEEEEERRRTAQRARTHASRQQKSNHRCDSHDVPRESATALLKRDLETEEGGSEGILFCSMGIFKSALGGPMAEERSPGTHVVIHTTPN